MRYPIVGKIHVGGNSFPIVGHIVDGPRRLKIGHAVLDTGGDPAADAGAAVKEVCGAIGRGDPVKIEASPNAPQDIEVNVIEFDSLTLRFTIK